MKLIGLLAFAGMIVMNYLANALPLNGKTTGQLSEQYPNLFTPAGITFSIWGVIYLLLLGYVVLQFTESHKGLSARTGWLFALSCLLNALWIVAWHYERLPLSMLVMLGLLATLILINAGMKPAYPVWTRAAFGIYLGWICIATIANATALLVRYNWGGWGVPEESWAIAMVAAGAAISALAMHKFSNPFVGISVIWALTGIFIKRQADVPSIAVFSLAAAVMVAVLTIWMFIRKPAW
jgi:hypothetical protein